MIRKNGNSRKPAGKSAKRAMAVNLALLMKLIQIQVRKHL